jgi:hypothetical protein
MKDYYYYEAIRKLIIQFMDVFNDIQVKRLTPDGKCIDKLIHVPIKLSVKEKFWYWLQERKDDEVLPMITVWLTTIDYATERQVNSFFEICKSSDNTALTYEKFPHPVPYNFTFSMNIWSLYLSDIDQILEQILPFFGPHIFIRLRVDELNIEYDVKVIFQSCTPEISLEMPDDSYRVINYTLDFVAQTWLFKPSVVGSDLIKCMYTNYNLSPEALEHSLDTASSETSASSGGSGLVLCGCHDKDGEIIWKYEELGMGSDLNTFCTSGSNNKNGTDNDKYFPDGCVEETKTTEDTEQDGECKEVT